jgi:hypothetical protein
VVSRPNIPNSWAPRTLPRAIRTNKPDAHGQNDQILAAQIPNPIYRARVPPAPDFYRHKSPAVSLAPRYSFTVDMVPPLPLTSATDWVSSPSLGFYHQLDGTHGDEGRFRGAQGDGRPIPWSTGRWQPNSVVGGPPVRSARWNRPRSVPRSEASTGSPVERRHSP